MFSNQQNKTIKRYGNPKTGGLPIDINTILEDLLLNDEIIIDSLRFAEISELIKIIGIDSTFELFNNGYIKVLLDPMDGAFRNVNSAEQPLQPNEYNFIVFRMGDYREYIHNAFQNLETLLGQGGKKFIKLKGLIAQNLLKYDDTADNVLLEQTKIDLSDGEFPLQNLEYVLQQERIKVDENFRNKIRATIDWKSANMFITENNLTEIANLDDSKAREIIQKTIFGISSYNKKILEMRAFDTRNEFKENEMFVLNNKLDTLSNINSSSKDKVALNRVLSLKNIPQINLSKGASIDIQKFVKIKNSKECKEFREWLRTINDRTTDEEILSYINSFKGKLANFYNSTSSKTIRFLANTAVGLLSAPASIGLGALDTFLLEKILPENGIVSFVNNKIPSIFRDID